jgi:hypothetical protein
MSLTPDPSPDHSTVDRSTVDSPSAEAQPEKHWRPNRLVRICFAIFTLEIGLFLVVFPWVDSWDFNYFQDLFPVLENIWDDMYFRGALMGLGFVNIYVAVLEVVKLLRKK